MDNIYFDDVFSFVSSIDEAILFDDDDFMDDLFFGDIYSEVFIIDELGLDLSYFK